jgi:hypothetical protein
MGGADYVDFAVSRHFVMGLTGPRLGGKVIYDMWSGFPNNAAQ